MSLRQQADLATPMAIRVAATLRIAERLAGEARTAAELAREAGVDAHALEQLLRHLDTVGVFRRDSADRYALTELGEQLREPDLQATLDIEGGIGRAELSFAHLLESVRTGKAAFPLHYGREFWDDLQQDAARAAAYDAMMARDVTRWAEWLIPAYDWSSLGHLVDVGGGNGTLLASILGANPTLRGTVFDQPGTSAVAAAVADRCDVVSGSFFDALPAGAGAYLLCAILHDWDDDRARAILARCAEAAGSDGRVLVVEKTGADGESPSSDMSLRMLVYFGARERGARAISALAEAVGLRTLAVHPAGDLSIVELSPA